jgi:DNA anti-recombination protein RmuC
MDVKWNVSRDIWIDSKCPEEDWYDSYREWIDSDKVREIDESIQTENETIHTWIDSL